MEKRSTMFIFLLFIISPFWAIIIYTIWIWNTDEQFSHKIWTLAILLSLYVSILGSTKELAGDFLGYHDAFCSVQNFGFTEFLLSYGKEPLFRAYMFVAYYIFGGHWKLFVFSFTFINYILLSYAIIQIAKKINANIKIPILALYFMVFFFQELAASGNAVRQCLAQSFSVVFFVSLYINNKAKWWVALCAVCTHTSCLPLLGLGLIPAINKRFSFKSVLKLLIPLLLLITVFYSVANLFKNVPFVDYIFRRASDSEQLLGQDSWQVVMGLSNEMIILLMILSYMVFVIYQTMKKRDTDKVISMVNLNIILILFLIICNAIGANYLLMRYTFYLFAFQNVLLIIYINKSKIMHNEIAKFAFMVAMVLYFFYNLTHNIFSYAPLVEVIFYPAPILLF